MTSLDKVRQRAQIDARTSGTFLNPDEGFLNDLLDGIRKNEERYGYPSCPCRVATGVLEIDKDIICPCWYRDPDVAEFDACYCALYVSRDVSEGKRKLLNQIPERRPMERQIMAYGAQGTSEKKTPGRTTGSAGSPMPVRKLIYCRQCGYVVFREEPPYICPICKAKMEMFADITLQLNIESAK